MTAGKTIKRSTISLQQILAEGNDPRPKYTFLLDDVYGLLVEVEKLSTGGLYETKIGDLLHTQTVWDTLLEKFEDKEAIISLGDVATVAGARAAWWCSELVMSTGRKEVLKTILPAFKRAVKPLIELNLKQKPMAISCLLAGNTNITIDDLLLDKYTPIEGEAGFGINYARTAVQNFTEVMGKPYIKNRFYLSLVAQSAFQVAGAINHEIENSRQVAEICEVFPPVYVKKVLVEIKPRARFIDSDFMKRCLSNEERSVELNTSEHKLTVEFKGQVLRADITEPLYSFAIFRKNHQRYRRNIVDVNADGFVLGQLNDEITGCETEALTQLGIIVNAFNQ